MKIRRDQRIFVAMMLLTLLVIVASVGQRFVPPVGPTPTLSDADRASATVAAASAEATQTREAISASPVVIRVASSNTKEDWMNAVVTRFNAENHTIAAGNRIIVNISHVTSGGSQASILDGSLQPAVWSPGDYSWVDAANEVWRDRTGRPLVADACPQTVFAPIGFAMWRPMAEALGWPDRPIGWDHLIALMAAPDGWGSIGHPEWGTFKFGHTHPQYSNVGMLMMVSLAYRTANRTSGLTVDEIHSQSVIDAFRQVELDTYHYGIQSRNLLSLMVNRGPEYLHAVTTSEAEMLKTNAEQSAQMRFPLAFIFPSDGTFWGEHPYCVLDAQWVSHEQREAAELFRDYLLAATQQALAIENYLRPIEPSITLHAPLALENGTDPRVMLDTVPELELPTGDLVNAVIDVFQQTKKPATIMLVLDTSGSMTGPKIQNAASSAAQFIQRLNPNDEVYAIGFSDAPYDIGEGGRVSDIGETLQATVSGIYAGGNTALHDAVCDAAARIETLRQQHAASETPHLYGIVLLSDGADTSSLRSANQMYDCLPSGENADGVKVFAIGYEVPDAGIQDILQRLASRTNGRYFDGSSANIDAIYNAISAEQ